MQRKQVASVHLHYFLISSNIIWLPWQRPLTNWEISACIWWIYCENWSSISWDIRLNMSVFGRVVPDVHKWALSTLELLDQSSRNFTKVHEMPERRIRGVCHFSTKLFAMATSLETAEKEVQIDHLHQKRFHSVQKCENQSSGSWDNCTPSDH